MALCVRAHLGERTADCKYCPTREILERDMWKYKWTQWAGDNIDVPTPDELFKDYPDLEKCKAEIIAWSGASSWEELMKRPNTSTYAQMAFAKYIDKAREWRKINEPYIEYVVERLKLAGQITE